MIEKNNLSGYLYQVSMFKGYPELIVTEGYVNPSMYDDAYGEFMTGIIGTSCSATPGEVAYGTVWLTERDDNKGKLLLMEYANERIRELSNRINYYHDMINILKK